MDILGTDKLMDELDDIENDFNSDNKLKMSFKYVLAYGKYCLRCFTLGLAFGTVAQVISEFIKSRFNK
ncbi:hypothetical protein BIHU0010003c01_00039 [Bifidobacterium phage BitterVaud1]|nr:hypothetical protein BIHU0010003c01_00039 [Bifidobacterium phage BitterVaud1]